MQVVILAGGLGTRLRPLTYKVPKPMIEVLGKPFLSYVVEMLKGKGVDDFVICSSYMAEKVSDYFGGGKKFGVRIANSIETSPMGTAGGIRNSLAYLRDTFVVLNGDTYIDIDYKKIYDYFEARHEPALMVLYSGAEVKNRVDNVEIDKDGIVTAYNKGQKKESKYGFAGVLLLRKKLVEKWPSARSIMLESEIFPDLIKKRQMASFIITERYYDIGTEEKLKAFEDFVKQKEQNK